MTALRSRSNAAPSAHRQLSPFSAVSTRNMCLNAQPAPEIEKVRKYQPPRQDASAAVRCASRHMDPALRDRIERGRTRIALRGAGVPGYPALSPQRGRTGRRLSRQTGSAHPALAAASVSRPRRCWPAPSQPAPRRPSPPAALADVAGQARAVRTRQRGAGRQRHAGRALHRAVLKHGLASRNTAAAFVNEMLKYGVVDHVADNRGQRRPFEPSPATLTCCCIGWRLHSHVGRPRRPRTRGSPARQAVIARNDQPVIADGLLASRHIRQPDGAFALFWVNDGGVVMDR